MIWIFIIVIILVCIVTAIIYTNHTMKLKWEEAANVDVKFVREAAEHSVTASNTSNPLIALAEVIYAYRTLEILIRRYGTRRADELTGIDTTDMLQTIIKQHDSILQSLTNQYPQLLPKNDLRKYAGFGERPDDFHEIPSG